uniref:RNA uridylyltransferase n=1 Tax=Parascaris univalens TaxID=6257 RepID=A0A915AW09_PARUN
MWATNEPCATNWEYGPPVCATTKRRERRRNRARRRDPPQTTATTQQVNDSDVEYIVQDDWSLRAVRKHIGTGTDKENIEISDATCWSTTVCSSDILFTDLDEPTTVWSSAFDESNSFRSSTEHGTSNNSSFDIVHKSSSPQVVDVDEKSAYWSTAENDDVEEGGNSWSTAVCSSDILFTDLDEPTTVWSSAFDESNSFRSSTEHGTSNNSSFDIVHKSSSPQVVDVDEKSAYWSTAENDDVEEGGNSWSTAVDKRSSCSSDDVGDTSSSVVGVCWSTFVDDEVTMHDKHSASNMITVHHDAVGNNIRSAFEQLPIKRCVLEDCTAIPINSRRSEENEFVGMVINRVFEELQISEEYMRMIRGYCDKLERNLRDAYGSDCRLTMFGSIVNGFGVIGSDVDISFRFGSDKSPKDLDDYDVIMKLAEVLRQIAGVEDVYAIPNAKVPIVKFKYVDALCHFESDLSLYNALALENTCLLREYSEIDRRIKPLGAILKLWSSYCGIRGASYGKLSSYALIVMLIHFLQRTTPPVLPFLQQAERYGRPKERKTVDGWDVYFCSAAEIGWKVENAESTSQLWLEFLGYYAEHFDFESVVVQIRMSEPVSKLQKRWVWRPVAIEDPFDLDRNLSNGVNWDTATYIKDSFLRSHKRFASLQYSKRQMLSGELHDFLADVFSGCRPVDDI